MSLLTNILLYYRFNGNYNNETSGSNVGTPTGTLLGSSFGLIKQGAYMNGVNALTDFGDLTAFHSISAFSVSTWLKYLGVLTGTTGILQKVAANQDCFRIWTVGTEIKTIIADSKTTVTTNSGITSGLGLVVNAWYHVVVVYDGSLTGNSNRLKIYVNDVQQTLTFANTIPAAVTNSTAQFENGYAFGINFLQGYQAELGIWSKPLTGAEITTLFNNGSGLTYPFNGDLYPNNECYLFCQWVLTSNYIRLTPGRSTVINNVSAAALAGTSVSQHTWNTFVNIMYRFQEAYNVNLVYQ